ncbi:E3 ubiquitin-protein ligase lubel-like [Frankliniella occidentalis]|uniref:E3 ubiquitin-protein ligase lubel-like n=1 Tax=Frankliniella occidentalis TaxID=133901 RepID=A0A9C6XUK0_FRAOC|nr:E3 ubiquitin-protein ligase lubel-like [Frankliniella occidentalis]
MNAAPPAKTNGAAGGRRGDGKHCDLCGSSLPAVRCDQCASQIFCYSCDDMYHRHPKRTTHVRKPLQQAVRPPLPPKGEAPPAPVPPPRRKGRTSRMGTPSPLDGQVNHRHSCALS